MHVGGYHEYVRGVQYIGDTMITLGDIISRSEDVQYIRDFNRN